MCPKSRKFGEFGNISEEYVPESREVGEYGNMLEEYVPEKQRSRRVR